LKFFVRTGGGGGGLPKRGTAPTAKERGGNKKTKGPKNSFPPRPKGTGAGGGGDEGAGEAQIRFQRGPRGVFEAGPPLPVGGPRRGGAKGVEGAGGGHSSFFPPGGTKNIWGGMAIPVFRRQGVWVNGFPAGGGPGSKKKKKNKRPFFFFLLVEKILFPRGRNPPAPPGAITRSSPDFGGPGCPPRREKKAWGGAAGGTRKKVRRAGGNEKGGVGCFGAFAAQGGGPRRGGTGRAGRVGPGSKHTDRGGLERGEKGWGKPRTLLFGQRGLEGFFPRGGAGGGGGGGGNRGFDRFRTARRGHFGGVFS